MVIPRIQPLLFCGFGGLVVMLGFGGATPATAANMKLRLLHSSGPTTIRPGGAVNFHVRVKGIVLDSRHIGGKPQDHHGHIQVYLGHIPHQAYRNARLGRRWLGSMAATTFQLAFPRAVLHGGKGSYTVLIAMARNNDVLYRVAPVRFHLKVT